MCHNSQLSTCMLITNSTYTDLLILFLFQQLLLVTLLKRGHYAPQTSVEFWHSGKWQLTVLTGHYRNEQTAQYCTALVYLCISNLLQEWYLSDMKEYTTNACRLNKLFLNINWNSREVIAINHSSLHCLSVLPHMKNHRASTRRDRKESSLTTVLNMFFSVDNYYMPLLLFNHKVTHQSSVNLQNLWLMLSCSSTIDE